MKLKDIVESLIKDKNIKIPNKDIENTVIFLTGNLDDARVLRRIVKKLNDDVKRENIPW